jgi:hypothetical protein
MIYFLYCSSGNTVGIEEYLCYSEVSEDGYWLRYIEIKADGTVLKYSEEHKADHHGMLPEGKWEEAEASKSKYGVIRKISRQLFEAVWAATRA